MTKPPRKPGSKPSDNSRRNGHARAVSELLPDIGRAAFRRYGFVQSSVVSRWHEIVGDRYAGVSSPESIRFPRGERTGGELNLVVAGAHVTMMQHIAPEIVERVNRFFGYGAVARIRFRQGEVRRPAKHAPRPIHDTRPSELGEGLRKVADPELREVLGALATSVEQPREIPVVGKVR